MTAAAHAKGRAYRGLLPPLAPIDPPGVVTTRPLDIDPSASLPAWMRVSLPSHDAQAFYGTFGPVPGTSHPRASELGAAVIGPILKAIRFKESDAGMRLALPPEDGIVLPPPPDRDLKRAFQFEAPGTQARFMRTLSRTQVRYPFQQAWGADRVPVEGAVLLVTVAQGASGGSVRGMLIEHYRIANRRIVAREDATPRGHRALAARLKIARPAPVRSTHEPRLVLLPYGNDPDGTVALRYAWRVGFMVLIGDRSVPVVAWVDAQSGALLELRPLDAEIDASARIWRRNPGTGPLPSMQFAVDPSAGERYVLQLKDVSQQVSIWARGQGQQVSISSGPPSSQTFADFDQPAVNDAATALCWQGGNTRFEQADFFALMQFHQSQAIVHGVSRPYPPTATPWAPLLQDAGGWCTGNANGPRFDACEGYYRQACPDYSDGTTDVQNRMNLVHDHTVVAHEMAHHAMARLHDWALPPNAVIGWPHLHDLADAWAGHFENTSCIGGWAAKNVGGVDASNNCAGSRGHGEGKTLPRLHELTVPLNPASPGAHFPEHRSASAEEYGDMQIAAAALWQVREGMRSLFPATGPTLYFLGLTQALHNIGYLPWVSGDQDMTIYADLNRLETEMIDQWANVGLDDGGDGGPVSDHSTHKVLIGFAKAGLFPIEPACLRSSAPPPGAPTCPAGIGAGNGAEAVVELDDNDLGDDLAPGGAALPERDVLRRGGPSPLFHVWTGARYLFKPDGTADLQMSAAPCNREFMVEVSTDAGFLGGQGVASDWLPVNTNNQSGAPSCYGAWSPDPAKWAMLQQVGDGVPLYYRATTRRADGQNVRVSTSPGNGQWPLQPPFTVITGSGRAEP